MLRSRRPRLLISLAAAGGLIAATTTATTPTSWAQPGPNQPVATEIATGVNPYLANLPDIRAVDYRGWRQRLAAQADRRAASAALTRARDRAVGGVAAAPFVHDEEESAGGTGSNDTRADAEKVGGFGTGAGRNPRVRILGQLPKLDPASRALAARREDNGSLRRSTATGISGIGARRTNSRLGDGPHGRARDGRNDFDFYALRSRAGLSITVDTTTATEVDTVVAIYSGSGRLLATNDDADGDTTGSRLIFAVPTTGTYYVLVAGYSERGALPRDPRNSGSGAGGAEEGRYRVTIVSGLFDRDFYAVPLAKGDVLGAVGNGVASDLRIWRPDGTQMVGAELIDASALYPPQSPLPGGGNTTSAYVAERAGTYVIGVRGGFGRYDTLLEVYRPGAETDPSASIQTVFLDFDGARVNTAVWGGPGVRTLSRFGGFLPRWGLTRSREAELIDQITAVVRENIARDLAARGLNDRLAVRVLNSKDSPDVFGETNVSRVIVGGTIDQSGIPTIGIAQYIDPGNYAHEDQALVLLDVLSDGPSNDASLNHYLRSRSNRQRFVARGVGNVISHEVGHLIGNFHTDNTNGTHQLMDSGGDNFGLNLYGVGRDRIGGTADDEDIDFGTDRYARDEGFTGAENTLNVSAWAFVRPAARP